MDTTTQPSSLAKGKGRAPAYDTSPSEITPLLASSSSRGPSSSPSRGDSPIHDEEVSVLQATSNSRRARLIRTLWTVFFTTLMLMLLVLLSVLFLAYSYQARASSISLDDETLARSVVWIGPESVDVINITKDEGVWVRVDGRVGVDAGGLMGFHEEEDDDSEGWLRRLWKSIGRWGIDTLGEVSIEISSITLRSLPSSSASADPNITSTFLASISLPPTSIPLTSAPPKHPSQNLSWLTPISLPIHIRPTTDTRIWLDFAKSCWKDGHISALAQIDALTVRGGGVGDDGWRGKVEKRMEDVGVALRQKIPRIPGLPTPGQGQSTSYPTLEHLVSLESFHISTVASPPPSPRSPSHSSFSSPPQLSPPLHNEPRPHNAPPHTDPPTPFPTHLSISARARVLNPIPALAHALDGSLPFFNFTVPSMPFLVAIPSVPANPNSSSSLHHAEQNERGYENGEGEEEEEDEPLTIAYVETAPFQVTSASAVEQGNLTLRIEGYLLPLPGSLSQSSFATQSSARASNPDVDANANVDANARSAHASRALSAFLSTYLSSQPSLILISSPLFPAPPPSPSPGNHEHEHDHEEEEGREKKKKTWIKTTFPAPVPKPRILRDVTIKDMVIRPPGSPAHLTPLAPSDVRLDMDTDDGVSMTSTNWVVKSGTVLAKVVLPKGLDVRLDVRGVLPDLLIFDGAVPVPPSSFGLGFDGHVKPSFISVEAAFDFDHRRKEKDADAEEGMGGLDLEADTDTMTMIAPPLPPERPLPSPIPPNAFAHIRPGEWLVATSHDGSGSGDDEGQSESGDEKWKGGEDRDGEDGEEEEEGSVTYVSAQIVDVPLEVLPGRENDFGKFVRKVIFGGSEGALAGIQGVAGVVVSIDGLLLSESSHMKDEGDGGDGGEEKEMRGMVLQGLPFEGNVRIGKKSL